MTYTFKLARRLAVSRTFGMLPAILLFAACSGGDATAPESPTDRLGPQQWRPREEVPVTVTVNPSNVTVETNQLIRFLAYGRNSAGDSVYAPITWRTTGGSILPDGRFSSAAVGTFMVTGRARDGGEERIDTSIVEVIRRQIQLASINIAPGSATLAPGVSQHFAVTGRMNDGRAVPVGVTWTATGGTIDAGGNYVAGDTAGAYQVIANHASLTLADTALVTITAPPAPPPPPAPAPPPPSDSNPPPPADTTPTPPPPPPPPVLGRVTLVPASATLAPSGSRQFAAYGRTTAGDSVAVSIVFSATGGSVTSSGLYTAGSTAGTYRIIATSGSLADTSTITVTRPLGSGSPMAGIAFGAFHVPVDSLNVPSLSYSGAVMNGTPDALRSNLERVRARGGRVVIAVRRTQTKDATGRLSVDATRAELERWRAAVDLTPYLTDGTVIGIYLTDDIAGSHLWGGEVPPMARIDSLALLVKTFWPQAVPMVRARPTQLVGHTWRWLEAAWSQYNGPFRDGPPERFRDTQVAAARALGLGLVLSFNALAGGCGPTTACLPGIPGSPILGVYANSAQVRRYQMSAAEVLAYGRVFVAEPYVCASLHWQWSPIYPAYNLPAEQLAAIRAFDTRSDVRAAMAQLREGAAGRANTSCRQR
jgi:hypothetical protein